MQYMCAYEVAYSDLFHLVLRQLMSALKTVALGYSKFCELFTEDEWEGFSYVSVLFLPRRSCSHGSSRLGLT